MKEYELGKEGERQARLLLKKWGFELQSPDWLGNKDNQWVCFEVKKKERFEPPPFEGHGLDKRQIYLRKKLFKDKSIRTMLIIFEVPTNKIFYKYLDLLENDQHFDTMNGIRIYPLSNFLEYKK